MLYFLLDIILHCIEKPISKLFEKLGHLVGSYPFCFFVIPLMMSAALGGGLNFLKVHEDNDIENQFTPINGPSKQARHFVKETFPSNDSLFSSQRLYAEGNYAVMIFSIVEGNILTDKHTTDGIPLFSITYSLAISFSVLSCMR
uniref:Uncharacterized protein n=1 Tax=Sinocyclocheilus grahami TaxID=75366 RepID=A0A672KYC6_SINGR